MKRLLSNNKHSVLGVLPYILIHVKRCYWHVDPTREKFHLVQEEEGARITLWSQSITD